MFRARSSRKMTALRRDDGLSAWETILVATSSRQSKVNILQYTDAPDHYERSER